MDLSQVLEEGIPLAHVLPPLTIEDCLDIANGDMVNCQLLRVSEHTGTHCDAPRHVHVNGATIDSLAVGLLVGPITVYDFSWVERGCSIGITDLEQAECNMGVRAKAGDVVLIRTDHSRLWAPSEQGQAYLQGRPYLSKEAGAYLAELGIKALGIDTGGPDPVGSGLPVHRLLLGKGISIIESLCNLDLVPTTGYLFLGFPLKIRGGSGSPIRAVAISPAYLRRYLALLERVGDPQPQY